MISGRGLGHTGGTLDKLESIPGFSVRLSLAEFRAVLRECGARAHRPDPGDRPRRPQALRAARRHRHRREPAPHLRLDHEQEDGGGDRRARPRREERRRRLPAAGATRRGPWPRPCSRIGKGMGKKVAALITDMDQPLGRTVGNALEVAECVETLKGRGPTDLESLSVELAAWMVHLAGAAASPRRRRGPGCARRSPAGPASSASAGSSSCRAATRASATTPRSCPRPGRRCVVRSERDGRVARLAARAIGHAGMLLGAGRETVDGAIDPAVGFVFHKKVGDPVAVGEPIVTVHVGKASRREEALARLREAIVVAPEAPPRGPLVLDILAYGCPTAPLDGGRGEHTQPVSPEAPLMERLSPSSACSCSWGSPGPCPRTARPSGSGPSSGASASSSRSPSSS